MYAVPVYAWRGERVSHLVLGTAQLGQEYGIANNGGRPTPDVARELVIRAWEQGVTMFDTAQTYGDSEELLGAALEELGVSRDALVVTKLAPTVDVHDPVAVRNSIEESCTRLRVDSLWGLLLHREEGLAAWHAGLGRILGALRDRGLVRYLGVSVYSPEAAARALEMPDIDLLQVPCNAWDQRMLISGVLEAARMRDKLCCVRSVYLQGLLTLSPTDVAGRLPQAGPAAMQWTALARSLDVAPQQLAMRFARSLNWPLVIGIETPEQLAENLHLLGEPPLSAEARGVLRRRLARRLSAEIVNPSAWRVAV